MCTSGAMVDDADVESLAGSRPRASACRGRCRIATAEQLVPGHGPVALPEAGLAEGHRHGDSLLSRLRSHLVTSGESHVTDCRNARSSPCRRSPLDRNSSPRERNRHSGSAAGPPWGILSIRSHPGSNRKDRPRRPHSGRHGGDLGSQRRMTSGASTNTETP